MPPRPSRATPAPFARASAHWAHSALPARVDASHTRGPAAGPLESPVSGQVDLDVEGPVGQRRVVRDAVHDVPRAIGPHPIVGGSAIALLRILSSDFRATQCGAPSKPQPTTQNGLSGIWRLNYSVGMACPTAKTTRIKLTRPIPKFVHHCNDAISRIQEGPRPWCTQARSLSARDGEDSRDRT